MAETAKLTNLEIQSMADREVKDCVGYLNSTITAERETALRYYNGEPFGDEQEGRSSVISRDVLDAVEWALPSLLRIFAGTDNVVEYEPTGPEDEATAKQATDYVGHVFYKDNPGFQILYGMFKDALLQKVGVVKHWWETGEKYETATFTGLDEAAYVQLVSDDDIEVLEHSTDSEETVVSGEDGQPIVQAYTTHDVKIRRKCDYGKVAVEGLPPEEFLISSRAKSVMDASFVGHRTTKTRSDLIEMGFKRDEIEELGGSSDTDEDLTGENQARFNDEDFSSDSTNATDPSMREILIVEGYMRADVNGDGIAERIRVWLGGSGAMKLLTPPESESEDKWEEIDEVPFSAICPLPIPHKFFGMSLADLVLDVQLIKSTLMRQALDNLYLTNNPEKEVAVPLVANMDDFLMSRPGGIKRVKQIGACREIAVPFTAEKSFLMLDYLDRVKETRTGSSPSVSADSEALQNQSATAVQSVDEARDQRLELIARIFAETGVKDMFRAILKLIIKNQDKPRMIRLRNEWVEMDPRYWNAEMDVTINVGLGHGSRSRQAQALIPILGMQREALAAGGLNGMVTPKHIYATASKLTQIAGFKNTEAFFADPGDGPMPTPPNPKVQEAQAKMQLEGQKMQMQAQNDQQKIQADMQADQMRAQVEIQMKREQMAAEMQLKREQMLAEMALKKEQMILEAHLSSRQQDTNAITQTRMGGEVG